MLIQLRKPILLYGINDDSKPAYRVTAIRALLISDDTRTPGPLVQFDAELEDTHTGITWRQLLDLNQLRTGWRQKQIAETQIEALARLARQLLDTNPPNNAQREPERTSEITASISDSRVRRCDS